MVCVCMGEQNCIDTRKLGHLHAGSCHPWQEIAELVIEVWIGQNTNISEMKEQRRVTNVSNAQPILGCRFSVEHHCAKVIHRAESQRVLPALVR